MRGYQAVFCTVKTSTNEQVLKHPNTKSALHPKANRITPTEPGIQHNSMKLPISTFLSTPPLPFLLSLPLWPPRSHNNPFTFKYFSRGFKLINNYSKEKFKNSSKNNRKPSFYVNKEKSSPPQGLILSMYDQKPSQ